MTRTHIATLQIEREGSKHDAEFVADHISDMDILETQTNDDGSVHVFKEEGEA